MNVPLLDLKLQYRSLKKELDEALLRVADSQHFILGPEVGQLESELNGYLGCKHSVGVSSGTDALLVALMAIDIRPGDEVIVPSFSFFATAGVIVRLHAVPVFADIDPVTFNIDPKDIEHRITQRTKAIIPVHLFGQSAAMDEVISIAKNHGLKVVEDAAQAIGVQYRDGRCVGTIGDVGCFSFFPSKNLGCFGDGGLVTTNDDALSERLRILRVHGGKPKYYHKIIGGNFRLDAIQAAVLRVKLPWLNRWSEQRRTNAALYTRLFIEKGLAGREGITSYDTDNKVLLPSAVYKSFGQTNHHIYNQYNIRVQQRDALRTFLSGRGIGTEIYYPIPFHRQECFSYLKSASASYPVSDSAAAESVALPIFPELMREQIEYVVTSIEEFTQSHAKGTP